MKPYTSEEYELMSNMTEEQLAETWREDCTMQEYEYMLECLPPRAMKGDAFLVGECLTHGIQGAIYDAFTIYAGRYFYRPAYVKFFDPINYQKQIQKITGE